MERYENLGVVGEGSYGVVLKCRHRESGQVVAIKKFLESDEDLNVKKIALREVRMLKKLRHENLINLIEFFRRKRRLYLVFEYVDHTVLDELEATDNGLDPETTRNHIYQVIRGVAFCHQNRIVHRDVKPENVLVSRLGVIKLCDFGFARQLEGPNESCTDYVATRWYRAPELLVGDTKYGREVDIWAIGCLLAEILSGEPLFPGESDIDQLFHIIQTLGELSSSHKHLVEKNPMLSELRLPSAASTPLSSSFPRWSPRTLNFISDCLDLTPPRRPTAEGLLKHEYFTHDKFPEKFLPELMKKVAQEFSANILLHSERKGSCHSDRKNRKSKNEGPANQSFKHLSTNYQSKLSPQKQSFTSSMSINSTYVMSQDRSNANLSSSQHTPITTSSLYLPVTSLSYNQSTTTSTTNLAQSPAYVSSYLSQATTSTSRPYVPYSSIASLSSGTRNNLYSFEDGPISLPFSHIPPIKETQQVNSNVLNNWNVYSTTPSSQAINLSSSSYLPNKNNSQTTLNLQLMTSPTRSSRKESKKSSLVYWSSGPKTPNSMLVQGQNQVMQDQSTLKDNNTSSDAPAAPNSALTPISPFSRHHAFDFNRHPYAISLDRSKDSSLQKGIDSRDPLKEIKDNGKEGRKDSLINRDSTNKDSRSKTKKDVFGWAKPRLLNDELYLPNVPGVYNKSILSTSPKKSSRAEASSGERLRKGGVTHKDKNSPGGIFMPFLSNIDRGSASSTDSFETIQAASNLPHV